MKVQTYILGFLIRFGPQHGYKLKQMISENVADFTRIKLPTIYYHLEKMKQKGLVEAYEEREGNKPERSVYRITEAGKQEFAKLLKMLLTTECGFEFDQDAVVYFTEFVENAKVLAAFKKQKENLEKIVEDLKIHQAELVPQIPTPFQRKAELIFSHHLLHYQTEIDWLNNAIQIFTQ